MPLHSGTRLLARVVVASVAASLVVSTMQLPGVKRNVAQAAGVATVDSYASFNGTSQYFTASHHSDFNFTGNITFSAWIRPSATCFTANRYCQIINKENSWQFVIAAGELQYAFMNSGVGWDYRSTGVKAISGQWQHISYATNKATNTITLFLNGRQVFTQTNSTNVPNPSGASTQALMIGYRENASAQYFAGDIDEVRVYNTVRATEALAQADMNTWGPANNTGLVLYYDFNEGTGTALNNTITGAVSATHMTAVGSPTWADVKTTTTENNKFLVAFPRSYLTSAGGYTMPTGVTSLDYLVVAGGGGGMARHGGGGGAGGLLTATNYTIASGAVLSVAVGGGGLGHNALATLGPANGANSSLSVGGTAVATAAGGGAGNATGGSGGGSNYLSTYGSGTAGQGNRGGAGGSGQWACTGTTSGWCGGGGGGAGAVGVDADSGNNNLPGNGGVGLASALLTTSAAATLGIGQVVSSSVFFAGGGGGGADVGSTASSGGSGGGAAGTVGNAGVVVNGTRATGGGGGGGGYDNNGGNSGGGSGGSGVILLSYALACTVTTTSLEGGVTQVVLTSPSSDMGCASTWTSPAGVTMVDAVIVGGGGGGGGGTSDANGGGGGGGAGGQVKRLRSQTISASTGYSVVVGSGGVGGAGSAQGTATNGVAGGSSSAFSTTSSGGNNGTGSVYSGAQTTSAGDGGSTLTSAGVTQAGGANLWEGAGGGAGAGSPGDAGTDGTSPSYDGLGGKGGNGQLVQWFSGSCASMFGGGGGGGGAGSIGTSGIGGPGGGGAAATFSTAAVAGTNNCGGGGGGGYEAASYRDGARGGHGVVMFRYNYSWSARTFATGSVTVAPKASTNMGLGTSQVQYFTNGEVVTAQLTSTNGNIGVTLSGSATVSAGANNSADLTIKGSQTDVNNTLNSATLTTDVQGPGQVTLRINAAAQDQTINGLTFKHSDGHFYANRNFGTGVTRSVGQAAEDARNYVMGGRYAYLATISAAAENTFIVNNVRTASTDAWIGLADDVTEGTFIPDGPDLVGFGRYTNWGSGEPNNCCLNEDFASYSSSGVWNDRGADNPAQYAILELEPTKTKKIFNINFSITGNTATTGKASRIETVGAGDPIVMSHFDKSETMTVTVSVPAGSTVSLTGITATAGANGSASVTFEGTRDAVNTALSTLILTAASSGTTTVTVSYRAKGVTVGSYKYNSATDSFYLLDSTARTFAATVTNAEASTFGGVRGFLATVLTDNERLFIKNNVTSGGTWINGRDEAAGGDATVEGQWVMDGNDAYKSLSSESIALDGGYAPWYSGEPSAGAEGCLQGNAVTDFWNDVTCTATASSVYEFKPYTVSYAIPVTVTNVGTCTTTTSTSGKYTLQQVTPTGHCNWTVPTGVTTIDTFIQGAGGGGGSDAGSGGNGGTSAMVQGRAVTGGNTVNVYVGEGGTGGQWAQFDSLSGEDTFVTVGGNTLTAAGGPGGNLGPASSNATASTAGIGFSGGLGGTSAAFVDGAVGGAGKTGSELLWSGVSVEYGGGGGGGAFNNGTYNLNPASGASGGGAGCDANTATNTAGSPGTANRGGGGGSGCAGNGGRTQGGTGGTGTVIFRYATDPLDAFPATISSLRAYMTADSFQKLDSSRRSWVDTSGNLRHATTVTGTPAVTSVTGNGATETVRTLSGGVYDGLRFPTGFLSDGLASANDYTFFHIARYSGATRGRIFDATNTNWLSGFWSYNAGVAYHNNALAPASQSLFLSNVYNHTNWVLSVDQPQAYRHNAGEAPSATRTDVTRSDNLTINYGQFSATEPSDWNVAEVIVFSRVLTAAEIRQVEAYLVRKYGLTGVNTAGTATLPLTPKSLATNKTSITASDRVNVTWAAPNDVTGITDYTLEYKKSTDSTWLAKTHTASSSYLSDTVTGLDADTQYDFRVRAVDSGASNRPNTATVTGTTKKSSTVTLTAPATPRRSVAATISAAVTSTATGTVTFLADGSNITGCVNVAVSSSAASCSWTPAAIGAVSLTATYSGDTSFAAATTASASSVTVTFGDCAPTITVVGRFTLNRFLDSTSVCNYAALPTGVDSVDILVVGGGGGGGENVGSGGGGGGGYEATNVAATSANSFTVTVGAGGRAGFSAAASDVASADRDGGVGGNSSITWNTTTLTGTGGGAGQTAWSDNKCGGVGWNTTRPSGGTGSGTGGTAGTGGQGGIGDQDGSSAGFSAQAGGNGFSSSIMGTNFGGGGGGGGYNTSGGAGGAGGGGGGGTSAAGGAGTANTGGGGGGGIAACTSGGAGGSGIVIMRYANVPTISGQPTARTVSAGTSTTFAVTAAATGATLAYQWQKNGVDISGATAASYTVASPVVGDAGTYRVVVRNFGSGESVSSVTSSAVALGVNVASQTITFGTLSTKTYGDASVSVSPTASSGLSVTTVSNDTSVCTISGGTVTIVGAGTCSLTASQAGNDSYTAATSVTQTFTVNRKTLTLSGLVAANKIYDRATTATVNFATYSFGSSVVGSDVVTLNSTSYLATFASINVANGITVTVTGLSLSGTHAANYQLPSPITTTANITAKEVTVTGVTASNKTYDGNTTATLVTTSAAVSGYISPDTATFSKLSAAGTFDSADVANDIVVRTTGFSISGGQSANYSLTQPTALANITQRDLTVSGITASNKTYDDTNTATLVIGTITTNKVGSDAVTVNTASATGTFADKNKADGITVQVAGVSISGAKAGNYNLLEPTTTANISVRPVTVTGITVATKEYDRTTAATLGYGSAIINNGAGNDQLTLSTGSVVSTFNDKTAAAGKAVTVSGLAVSGAESANYSVTQPTSLTGQITAKAVTVLSLTATSKTYNGTTAAAFTGTATLSGVISGDTVSVSTSGATATFDTKDQGTSKVVSVVGVALGGSDASNYVLTQPTLSAAITKKNLTVSGLSGVNRVYNRTVTATFTGTALPVGKVGSEDVTVSTGSATATFADKTVADNKIITVVGATLTGSDAGNYTLTQPQLTANITAAPLSVSGVTANNKVYNGNTTATLTDTNAAVSGVIGADDVTLVKTGKAATFGTATVGSAKSVTVVGYTMSGTDAANYTLTQPTGLTANITEASSGLTWSAPSAITYGTDLSATQLNATASVSGTFVYTPALGTKLAAGTHTLSVTFTPDSTDYASATTTVSITVNKKALTITASSESLPYGSAIPTITPGYSGFISGESATALTTQPECSTVYTRLSTANTSQATTCTGATAANYAITAADGAVTVTKRFVTVTASSPSRAYGDAQGTITPSYSSDFQNGDTSSVVSSMSCGTGYTSTSAAATTHSTFCNSGTATNYQFTYVNGSITVAKKDVAVTASSHNVNYGDSAPTITPSYGTFANGDTSSVVSNMACTTSYSGTTPVASSGIATSCSAGTAANYQFTYTTGAITIAKKTLTVTASSHIVTYGDSAPSPTPSYDGWVNSQGVGAITTAPTCTTAYTNTTAVASSGIATSCSGGLAANYSFTFVAGAVTISKKSVAITASSPTVTYGDVIPAVTASYGPFVNGDSSSVVSNTSCTTVYVRTSNVGSLPATSCSGATASNYSFTYTSGSVVIEKKTLTVTASSHSVTYGDAAPTVTPSYSPFINGDTSSVVSNMACTTSYSGTTPVASSGIATSCSSGTATNYQFTYTTGAITIAKKTLTVTTSSHTVTYGDSAPSPTPSYDGWVNSQGVGAITTVPTCTTAYTNNTAVALTGIATSCSGGLAANYAFAFVAGAITINAKGVVVTASSPTVTYGDVVPSVTPLYSDFANSETSAVVSNTACTTVYARTSNVGSLPATSCSGATASNYSFTYTSGSVVIEKKTLTVTASSPSAAYGVAASTITVTPLYSNWVNSDTSSVIDTAPTCSTAYTNTSAVGSAPYTRCSGGSDNNYSFSFVDGAVQVGTATVTITAENKIATYGTALGQSISVSGLANSDSVDSVVYTYAGSGSTSYTASTTRPTAVGGYAVTPSSVVLSAGSSSNYSFNYVAGTATINKKGITVTGSSPTVLYGASVPTITPLYSSDFAYGETSSVVSNTVCSTAYAVTSNVGSAPATSCSGATASNYSFTYVDGSVNVQKKTLTVTASSPSATYGVAASTITVTPLYSDWANSDTSSVIDTAPTCTTAFTNTSAVGSAPYTRCSGGSDNNYSFSFVDGAVLVGAATVTITAENKTATYGTALGQSASVSGLANSDSVDSVVYTYAGSGATSYSASTTRPAAVGGYSIAPSAVVLAVGALSNYSFNYVAGTATINKKGITVTGSSPAVLYGASVPTITPLYSSEFAYGETSSVVSNTTCSTVYAVTSNVGSAPATSCSGATASNYSFTYVDGSVNVQKRAISVTASSHSVIYGDAKPTVAPEYSGFMNDQDATAFTTAPTCDTTYSTTSGFGFVASTCSGGSAANYSFNFTAGVISIAKRTLTVTAPSPTVTYGDTAPTLSATITGWVNSETSTVLTTLPTCSTAYTNASNANTAPSVNCAGAVDDNYAFSYVSGAFTINKANQSAVTVSATDAQLTWQPGPGYATTTLVGADGDGDGSFTYSVTSTNSVCSITGSTLTALTAGVCKLTATKATSTNYLAATSSEFSYTITKAAQTITFATLTTKTYGDASFSISTSTSSGLIVSFAATSGVCSVGASSLLSGVTTATVSIVAAGNCTITASQSGNINYTTATAETGSALARTFTIARKSLTIQNATASNKVFDTTDTATGDLSDASLMGVQFSDDVSITQTGFSAAFADANAADNKVVTFAGVTLSGTKAANYSVVQPTATANITKASSGLAWQTPASVVYGTTLSATQLSATTSVEGSFTYTPSAGTLLNAGTRTLSVTFTPTSSNFSAATTTVALVVNQKPVTVTAANRSVVYGNSFTSAFTTTAFVGSDAASAVTYTYSGTGGTAYSASVIAPTTRGSYFITPSLISLSAGNLANYDVTYVDGTLSITQAEQGALIVVASSQSLTFSPIPSPATASLSTLAGAEGSGTGVVSYAVVSGNTVCSISGSTLTALTAGTCSITVTRDADINFVVKTSEAITITIAKSSQTLTFASISNKTYGDANFSVTPTASSGLTVSLSSATPLVCDIPSALTLRIVDVGTCTVVAAQVGNINYEPATASVGSSTTRSFSVARKVLTVSGVSTVSRIYDGSLDATAQLQFTSAQLDGVVGGDTVSLNSASASGAYVNKTANTNKAIAISGLALQGIHASRYSVQAPSDVVGTVTQASLTTSGIVVVARAYDGTRTATINSTNYAFAGVFGSDAVVLDASNYGAIYDTATASTSKSVTVSALALSGTDAANYSLVQPMLVGAINKATATVIFSTPLTVVYDATSHSVGTTTTPSALTVVVQYSGRGATTYATSSTGPIDAGSYGVAASINETNYLGTNAADFTVEKQVLPVALETAALNTTFTGRARFVGATTTPLGKQVGVSYLGSGSTTYAASTYAPTNAGTYAVTATIEERNFQGTSTQTLTVTKANQETLSIVNTAPVVYGDTTTSLLAKGGTGNGAISYVKVSGSCTINSATGAVLTTGVGSCVIRASKAASDNVEAAVSANRTLEIVKASQEVAFTSSTPSSPVAGDTYQPTAVSSAGLPVSIVVTVGDGTACSRSGSTVTFVGSGVCEITASQAGTALYEAATSVRQSFEVGKMNQSISFPQLPRKRITDPSFMLEASASSGLTVTYVLTSGSSVCALDANGTVSPLSVGTCTITASQAGDAVVAAAAPVVRTVSVVADVSSAPKITSISGGDAMITVGYLPPSFDGGSAILGYRLTVQPTSGAAVTSSNCDLVARACVVTGLINGTAYSVSLAAINAAGAGVADVAPGTTTPAPVLEAVRNVAGQRNDASMSVTWEDPETFGDGTFTRYELSIREEGGGFSPPVTVQSLPRASVDMIRLLSAPLRQHTFTNLDNTKTYFVKIVTITTAAVSARSSNTAAATLFPLEAPSAPLDVAIDSATGRIATVSWKAPVSDGGSPLIRYVVSSSHGTCALATLLAVKCSVSGLIPGQSFSVNVRAVNSVGQSAATTESITLPDLPSAPSISNVLIGGLSASVTWTAPSSNGGRTITNYAVSAINASNSGDVVRCTTTALTCTVNSLKVGTTYNIIVRARNSVGEGATSAQFSAQTAKPAPVVSVPPTSGGAASGSTVWQTYRTENAGLSQSLVGLPPAPAKVRIASAGARTKVTATGTKTSIGVITQAIITISSKSKKVLARISVRVSSDNPTATVTVPFKSQLISVSVQFANDFGVSTGGPTGVNVREGNTYDSTVVGGKPQLMGSVTGSPVYFNSGSSTLTPSGMKQLRAVAETVKQTAGLVYVTGYSRTDEVRGWTVDALARARAETVAKYLAKLGVRQWIKFQGAGALKSDWGDWRDRRVVVHAGGNFGSV